MYWKVAQIFRTLILLQLVVALTYSPEFSNADVFKYKDSKGNIHYVDNLSKIPEKYRKNEIKPHKLPNITRERKGLYDPIEINDLSTASLDSNENKDLFDEYLAKVDEMPPSEIEEIIYKNSDTPKEKVETSDTAKEITREDIKNFVRSDLGKKFLIGMGIVFLTGVISMWTLLERGNLPGFGILIPVYNLILLSRLGGFSGWWILWIFIPVLGGIVWSFSVTYCIAKNFGYSDLFAIGTVFFPFIFMPIMAFSPTNNANNRDRF